nr:hypothetical protein [uncultured Draconibacterium sp.]
MKNLNRDLLESQLIKIDTVSDKKFENGIFMQLYLLKYKDKQNE